MSNITNIINNKMTISGTIKFTNEMVIDGKVEGAIVAPEGTVTIAQNAQINANIQVKNLTHYGSLIGNIVAQNCTLMQNSSVQGDIKSNALSMESGALLQGKTETGDLIE